jgi:hypothetical protein
MSLVIQFWQADGPNGESLIKEYRGKQMTLLADAIYTRPAHCVLVTMQTTDSERHDTVELYRKPGYSSGTGTGDGLLQTWAKALTGAYK